MLQILRYSSSNASAVHLHNKSGTQNSNYNLGGVIPSRYSYDLHTGENYFFFFKEYGLINIVARGHLR